MQTDLVKYLNCMHEIRERLSLVISIIDRRQPTTGVELFDAELIFVQLRKTLELIAFGSLTAHREKYSEAYKNFASHWKVKSMLECIEKINPNFYPVPLQEPRVLDNGVKHSELLQGDFLTRDEFEFLYDKSSDILHARNPFTTNPKTIDIGYSAREWANRIQRLLRLHNIELVSGSRWLIQIPNEGQIHGFTLEPQREGT